MRHKISLICILVSLSFFTEAEAQLTLANRDSLTLITVPILEADTAYPDLYRMIMDGENTAQSQSIMTVDKDHVYNTHFGFFCKQEAKRDKKSKVPVRMRLGTLEDVNRKEYGQK